MAFAAFMLMYSLRHTLWNTLTLRLQLACPHVTRHNYYIHTQTDVTEHITLLRIAHWVIISSIFWQALQAEKVAKRTKTISKTEERFRPK